jgi:hypothetical protein
MDNANFHHEPHDENKSPGDSPSATKFRWKKFIGLLTLLYAPSIYAGLNWGFTAFFAAILISVGLLMAYNGLRFDLAKGPSRLSFYFGALGNICVGVGFLCKILQQSVLEMICVTSGVILSGISIPMLFRKRFQFTLRTLFIVMTAVALLFGIISSYPVHFSDLRIPRIDGGPKSFDLTHPALHLDFSIRWGQIRIHVEPEIGFDKTVTAELFWMESGNFRHRLIADQGQLLVADYSIPNQDPLVLGAIVYHPKINHIMVRMIPRLILNDGLDETLNSNDPMFTGGIEQWGPNFLKKIQKRIP